MFYFLKLVLSLVLLVTTSSKVFAADLGGVSFPDKVQSEGVDLVLNGLGLRAATIFGIKVYVAGLYLQSENQDPESIIASTQNKRLEMRFIRKISRTKIRRAWIDGFESNNDNLNPIRGKITEFSKAMTELKSGDILLLEFVGAKTTVSISGKKVADISGLDFARALLRIWLGKNPPNESLKKGLLGSK